MAVDQRIAQQLREGAQQIALKSDFQDEGIIGLVLGVIEDLTGVDISGIVEMIDSLVGIGIATVQNVVNQILDVINGLVVTPINNAIAGFIDWFAGLLGFRQNTANVQNQTEQQISQIQTQVISKASVFDIPSSVPGWQSINPLTHSTILRTSVVMWTNATDSGSESESRSPAGGVAAGSSMFGFIRLPIDDKLKVISYYANYSYVVVGGTGFGSIPTGMYLSFYRMDPNGDLGERLAPESPNLVSQLLNGTFSSLEHEVPDEVLAEAGQWVAVGLRAVGGTVFLAGIESFDPEPLPGFNPKKLSATATTATASGFPTSVALSDLSFTGGFIPYFGVGKAIGQSEIKRQIFDNFDRPDAMSLGERWSNRGTNLLERVSISNNSAVWPSTSDGQATSLYVSPLTTDRVRGSFTVGGVNGSWPSRVLFQAKGNLSSWMAVSYLAGSIHLVEGSGYYSTASHESVDRAMQIGDLVEWEATPEFGYKIWVNGVLIITHTTTEVPTGSGARYCGISMGRGSWNSSGAIADFLAYDISDLEEGSLPTDPLAYPADDLYPGNDLYPQSGE